MIFHDNPSDKGHARIVCGSCADRARIVRGSCADRARIVRGSCTDRARIVHGSCASRVVENIIRILQTLQSHDVHNPTVREGRVNLPSFLNIPVRTGLLRG